jgi:hypothetical protein
MAESIKAYARRFAPAIYTAFFKTMEDAGLVAWYQSGFDPEENRTFPQPWVPRWARELCLSHEFLALNREDRHRLLHILADMDPVALQFAITHGPMRLIERKT